MKDILVLVMCVFGFLPVVKAQTGLGARGGATFSEVWLTPGVPQGLAQGMDIGIVGRFMNNHNLGLQVEANVSRQGWLFFPETGARHEREFTSVQVPVLTYLQLGRGTLRFAVQAGVFGGYVLEGRDLLTPAVPLSAGPVAYREQNQLPWQYGVMGAAGPALSFPFGIIHFEARFVQHLSDILEADFNEDNYFRSSRLRTITFGMQWVYMFGGRREK